MRGAPLLFSLTCVLARAAAAQTAVDGVLPTGEQPSYLKFHVSDQLVYDDNLYRIPKDFGSLDQLIGPGAKRDDYINKASVGTDDLWTFANQSVAFKLDVASNRFQNSSFLDYNSLMGSLRWNWSLARQWTGQVGTDYSRSLASFTNNRVFAKDLLVTKGYFAVANYHLNSGWMLTASAREAQARHGVAIQEINDSTSRSGSVGTAFESGLGNIVGAEYRFSGTTYPEHLSVEGETFDQSYHESTVDGYFTYWLSARTQFDGGGGYLEHRYPRANIEGFTPNFNGVIWHLSAQYQAAEKLQIVVSGRRSLRAYLDIDSDYFVSDVVSITPTWVSTDRLKFSLQLSHEHQSYLGSNPDSVALPGMAARRDSVDSAQAAMTYTFLKRMQVDLAYRRERRDSNRSAFSYFDDVASVSLRANL